MDNNNEQQTLPLFSTQSGHEWEKEKRKRKKKKYDWKNWFWRLSEKYGNKVGSKQ